jgi:DNA mismatch repair protein MutS
MDTHASTILDEVGRVNPSELLLAENVTSALHKSLCVQFANTLAMRPEWTFDRETSVALLCQQWKVSTLSGFGFEDSQPCLRAAGAILYYLKETLRTGAAHIRPLQPYRTDSVLVLDEVTRRSLELSRTLRDNEREGSLLWAIDRTVTPMGARFLHDAILTPLNNQLTIQARLDAVEELTQYHSRRAELRGWLKDVADLQRLTARVSTQRATPKDLAAVGRTLARLPEIKAQLHPCKSELLKSLHHGLETFPDLRQTLEKALDENPPYTAREGGIFKSGYHAELDTLRQLATDGKTWMARYQADQVQRTGIQSLKISYTQAIGYYIEVTNANEARVPPEYIHERTLKNCKRYTTPELREYQEKVLTAQDRAVGLEQELFNTLRDTVSLQTQALLAVADVLATVDFLTGLAELAATRNYVKPKMVSTPVFEVKNGRHPVLDQTLPPGTFVPNDIFFHPDDGMFWLITGPNMSGKSTFIRQTALLAILAHMGSFIPADSATIGLVDRVFTRVGASDELRRGQSTFMVEMTEAANILNNATAKSLVILDEIGRGTSTYDGVSLAWAMTEHLHDVVECRALFATHYHELAQLQQRLSHLRNYTVAVKESDRDIVFMHKIMPGNANKSYGIHVARLAGVPENVLIRADEVLASLESQHQLPTLNPTDRPRRRKTVVSSTGPSLFEE